MPVKIILLDLDGTLLRDDKTLSKENYDALFRAHTMGVHIVPSTGRFFSGMPQVVRDLPFIRYAVTINGAEVFDAKENNVIYRSQIPSDVADTVYDYMEKLPVIYDCYQDNFGWTDEKNYAKIDEFVVNPVTNHMVKSTRKQVVGFREEMRRRGKPVQKIQMFFKDMDKRAQVLKQMPLDFPTLAISSSIVNNIEINGPGATKGIALAKLCEHLGVDIKDTMAFGDGTNDTSMLKAAGIGVAMANAEACVKEAADFVTLSNEENGVAYAMHHFKVVE